MTVYLVLRRAFDFIGSTSSFKLGMKNGRPLLKSTVSLRHFRDLQWRNQTLHLGHIMENILNLNNFVLPIVGNF
jgi:hypothetical protein